MDRTANPGHVESHWHWLCPLQNLNRRAVVMIDLLKGQLEDSLYRQWTMKVGLSSALIGGVKPTAEMPAAWSSFEAGKYTN